MDDSDKNPETEPRQTEMIHKNNLKKESVRMRATRAGKLLHLTRRMNIIRSLTADNECINEVKQNRHKVERKV